MVFMIDSIDFGLYYNMLNIKKQLCFAWQNYNLRYFMDLPLRCLVDLRLRGFLDLVCFRREVLRPPLNLLKVDVTWSSGNLNNFITRPVFNLVIYIELSSLLNSRFLLSSSVMNKLDIIFANLTLYCFPSDNLSAIING